MKKRKGFFDDIEDDKNLINEPILKKDTNHLLSNEYNQYIENSNVNKINGSEKRTENKEKKSGKKKNIIISSCIAIILISFILVRISDAIGWFGEKNSEYPSDGTGGIKEEFYYYPADYETDIFTIPGYLELDRTIKYAPDTSQSYIIENGNYASEGEPALTVLGEYLNAAIAGDNEKVNSLFTEEYFNIEGNKRYEKFPPQKLFEIKIRNERSEKQMSGYTVYYFTVSYKIYKNDGLFRKGVDETREMAQIFEINIYNDGSGKINNVYLRRGYVLDI